MYRNQFELRKAQDNKQNRPDNISNVSRQNCQNNILSILRNN